MNLYQVREAIRTEMAQPNPNQARVTELIIERDRLATAEPAPQQLTTSERHARMLDALHA